MTDGGLETTLIFHEELQLPSFAAFDLLKNEQERKSCAPTFTAMPTWPGRTAWGSCWKARPGAPTPTGAEARLRRRCAGGGQSQGDRADGRKRAHAHEAGGGEFVISGNLGPRGDGYRPDARMSAREAEDYHAPQIHTFARRTPTWWRPSP